MKLYMTDGLTLFTTLAYYQQAWQISQISQLAYTINVIYSEHVRTIIINLQNNWINICGKRNHS